MIRRVSASVRCTTDTNCGIHFQSSIVHLSGTCSEGPIFTTPHPSTVCRCSLPHRHERFGPIQVPSSGTDRFFRCLKQGEKHSGCGGLCPKTVVVYYHEGGRLRSERYFAFHRRFAWAQGVSLRRQPNGRGDPQELDVFFIVNARVAPSDGLGGTTKSLDASVYPQGAQSGRRLFKTDRPRHVDTVTLRSTHAHAASTIYVSEKNLPRYLRLPTVKSDFSLRFQTLHSRDLDRGWTLTQLEQRSRLAEPVVAFVARRSL